jgi:hypothetical protein
MEWHPPDLSPPSAEELAAYVGPKADLYRRRFERFSRHGAVRFEFSWNWPAFFAGGWWYLYRKMYWWMAIDLGVSVLLGWTVLVPVLWAAARAVTGDFLYFRQADRKIRDARPLSSAASPSGDAAHLARLAREGGVHAWVPWVAVAGILLVFLISSLLFGILGGAIPPLRDLWPRGPGRWA